MRIGSSLDRGRGWSNAASPQASLAFKRGGRRSVETTKFPADKPPIQRDYDIRTRRQTHPLRMPHPITHDEQSNTELRTTIYRPGIE
jgi:hypothetical protein